MRALTIRAAARTRRSRLWIQWTLARPGRPTLVSFAGEIDGASAPFFSDALHAVLQSGAPGLILDLGSVDSVDAHGEAVLLAARNQAMALAIRLDVVCAAAIRSVLLQPGVDAEVLGVHATVPEALAARYGHERPERSLQPS